MAATKPWRRHLPRIAAARMAGDEAEARRLTGLYKTEFLSERIVREADAAGLSREQRAEIARALLGEPA